MREKGIIFDLDGTLWSTSAQIVPAWNEVLLRKGLPLITVEQMNSFMGKSPTSWEVGKQIRKKLNQDSA